MMKIVDVFPYFNEKELLELRINLLYDHVDKFIICDANRTHSGNPKDFTVKKTLEELNLLTDKIKIVEVDLSIYDRYNNQSDDCPFSNCNWLRERAQRNAASKYIDLTDVCIVSDCDEIIDPTVINYYATVAQRNPNNILRIPMVFLHNRADLQVYSDLNKPILWWCPFVCLKSHLKNYTLSQIREAIAFGDIEGFAISELPSIFTTDGGLINNAGWHFSWMGNTNALIEKYRSYAHNNDMSNSINIQPIDQAIKCIKKYKSDENSNDVLGRSNHILKKYDISLLPTLIFQLPNVINLLLPKYINFEEEWFNYPDLYLEMINRFPSGSKFVEVGCWKGQSSYFMCDNIIKSGKEIEFFCVDTWEGSNEHIGKYNLNNLYETFLNNMKLFESYYFPLKLNSIDASKRFKNNSLDFVFIDAAHDYESVKADILAWLPKLKKSGILAGHDYYPEHPEYCGVYQAVHEIFDKNTIKQLGDCFIIETEKLNE